MRVAGSACNPVSQVEVLHVVQRADTYDMPTKFEAHVSPSTRSGTARSHRSTNGPNPRMNGGTPIKSPKLDKMQGQRRALPGWAVDLITDGVAPPALRATGNKAVFGALVSTAMSAQQRGWARFEWESLVLEPHRRLISQHRRDGRGRRTETPLRVGKTLKAAWDAARVNCTGTPGWNAPALAAQVAKRHAIALAAAADTTNALSDADRTVLRYAAALATERGMTRVTLPWRTVQVATGLGERATKNALKRLTAAGYLILAQHGLPGGPRAKKRRANVYELALIKSRGTRPVGPRAPKVGPLTTRRLGTRPVATKTAVQPATKVIAASGQDLRLTRHPDGRIVLESTATTEATWLTLLATLLPGQAPLATPSPAEAMSPGSEPR